MSTNDNLDQTYNRSVQIGLVVPYYRHHFLAPRTSGHFGSVLLQTRSFEQLFRHLGSSRRLEDRNVLARISFTASSRISHVACAVPPHSLKRSNRGTLKHSKDSPKLSQIKCAGQNCEILCSASTLASDGPSHCVTELSRPLRKSSRRAFGQSGSGAALTRREEFHQGRKC